MTRDNTLITDPNSLFAISRALRKTIVKMDQNPSNRNNAIRDEKHLAYRSNNKDQFETFKYDVLTNLEQLDNYILELETVLGKITSDEDAVKLAQSVRKEVKKQKADTPKKKGRPRKVVVEGSGRYRGGALYIDDSNIIQSLRDASTSASITPVLRKIIQFFLQRVEAEDKKFKGGLINKQNYLDFLDQLYDAIVSESVLFNVEELAGTDEETAVDDIITAFKGLISQLPENIVPLEPATVADVEASLKGKRRAIPILTGNEFIIGTLSKINIILTKLIAEYNGKILVNYKKFLQSDLEEIALKVIDTQRRFNDLITYLQDYERGDKSVDIRKFLETIDNKFKQFIALSSRSIANFVNPNIQFLPNFSQQLSGQTFENQSQPFNLYQEILGNKQSQVNIENKNKKIASLNKVIQNLEKKDAKLRERGDKVQSILDTLDPTSENADVYRRQLDKIGNELEGVIERLTKVQEEKIRLQVNRGKDRLIDLPAVPSEYKKLTREQKSEMERRLYLGIEIDRLMGEIEDLSGRDDLFEFEKNRLANLRLKRDSLIEVAEANEANLQRIEARLLELAM